MNIFITDSWCSSMECVCLSISHSCKKEIWDYIKFLAAYFCSPAYSPESPLCIFHCLAVRSVCAMQRTCISCCILFFILCISPVCIFVFLLVQCVHQAHLLSCMVFFLSYVWIISKLADRNSAGFLQTKPFHQCTWTESIKGPFFSQESQDIALFGSSGNLLPFLYNGNPLEVHYQGSTGLTLPNGGPQTCPVDPLSR